jgi:hypothetical protein
LQNKGLCRFLALVSDVSDSAAGPDHAATEKTRCFRPRSSIGAAENYLDGPSKRLRCIYGASSKSRSAVGWNVAARGDASHPSGASADSRLSALAHFWPPGMRTVPAERRIILGEFAAFSGGLQSDGRPRRVCTCPQFLHPIVRIKVADLRKLHRLDKIEII